jgi:hypothetical protein
MILESGIGGLEMKKRLGFYGKAGVLVLLMSFICVPICPSVTWAAEAGAGAGAGAGAAGAGAAAGLSGLAIAGIVAAVVAAIGLAAAALGGDNGTGAAAHHGAASQHGASSHHGGI